MSERGRLRVHRGAAPGVGKTVAMLGEGRRRRDRGTDVVVAFVETHGREPTAAQLDGLELVPRRDSALTELDLHAVLQRRPEVALVDELAHTDVPGPEHDKRWQDVERPLETAESSLDRLTAPVTNLLDLSRVQAGVLPMEQAPVGPGLAIARGLTEAMHGRISLEDTPGGGLTVVVALPAATTDVPR